MVADLRKIQENQWVSEIRIDKLEFVYFLCLVTDRQIQPLIEQIRKQIPIHMQGNGYPDVFAFNK